MTNTRAERDVESKQFHLHGAIFVFRRKKKHIKKYLFNDNGMKFGGVVKNHKLINLV